MSAPREVVVIVGSVRKESFNRKMAKAIAAMAPDTMKLEIVEIGQLPLYNQDLEASPTAEVTAFKERVARADALLFVTPDTTAACPAD
jgi:chromate reductase